MDINEIEAKVADLIEGIILTKVDPDTLLICLLYTSPSPRD